MRRRLLGLAFGLLCGLVEAEEPLDVWVTLAPQAYFVERVGGSEVSAAVFVKPGRSPATYAPTPARVDALARGDLFFGIGVPAERRLLDRMGEVLESVRVVEAAAWVEEDGPESSAKEGRVYEEGQCEASLSKVHGEDPHHWLDPERMMAFTDCVVRELSEARPEAADGFAERGEALKARLKELDASLRERLAPYEGRAFFINHPSLGHFAERYGLEQRSIERAGASPSSRRVLEMVAEARASEARAILAQVQFNRSTADVLAGALEVPVLEVDPLAEDYLSNLDAVARQVLRAFCETEGKGSED